MSLERTAEPVKHASAGFCMRAVLGGHALVVIVLVIPVRWRCKHYRSLQKIVILLLFLQLLLDFLLHCIALEATVKQQYKE